MQDLDPIKTATELSGGFYRKLLDHGEVDRSSNARDWTRAPGIGGTHP